MAKPKPASDKLDKKLIDELKAFAEIREAIGDPEGKLMQPEVVAKVQEMVKAAKIGSMVKLVTSMGLSISKQDELWCVHSIIVDPPRAFGKTEQDLLISLLGHRPT